MELLSKNLELRFISHGKNANGETDFKGETSTLTTDERVEFLNEYARKLPEMFDDFSLTEPVITLEAACERMRNLKPQPLPEKRARITLDDWKWIGHGENKKQNTGMKIPTQNFRCFIEWELAENVPYSCCSFSMGDAAKMEFDTDGQPYYISDKEKHYISITERIEKIKFELDFVYRKWNLYINDKLIADFVPFSNPDTSEISSFSSPYDKSVIKHIWGVGYHRLTENDFEPFSINTFIDEDFKKPIDINGWNTENYNDSEWTNGTLPIVHGGERTLTWKMLSVSSDKGFIEIPDICDTAQIYADGELIADEFYYGAPWRIPARVLYKKECYLVTSEIRDDFCREF